MTPPIYSENYGIFFESEEEKQRTLAESIRRWRNSEAAMKSIEPLLRYTKYVVQMEEPREEELFERWRGSVDWTFQETCWTLIVGSESLRPVEARLRFALINGSTVLFCSPEGGGLSSFVLNLWLRSHCDPSAASGERAYCKTEDFQRCLEHLAFQPETLKTMPSQEGFEQ